MYDSSAIRIREPGLIFYSGKIISIKNPGGLFYTYDLTRLKKLTRVPVLHLYVLPKCTDIFFEFLA